MSDLHIRHWGTAMGVNWFQQDFVKQTQTDAEILILAGDIVDLGPREWRWSIARLQEFAARYQHVVYVPGNHEFYGTGIDDVDLIRVQQEAGVWTLSPRRPLMIDGQRFLGGVMFQPAPPPGHIANFNQISDHWCISDFKKEAPRQYGDLRAWLESELRADDVVVTHHAPSTGSLDAQWIGNPSNHWFITDDMEDLIMDRQPRLWVHGHVHTGFDYYIGNTRVVCEPMGYPGEGVWFNPKKIVEI